MRVNNFVEETVARYSPDTFASLPHVKSKGGGDHSIVWKGFQPAAPYSTASPSATEFMAAVKPCFVQVCGRPF